TLCTIDRLLHALLAKSVKCFLGMNYDQILVVEDNCSSCNKTSLQLPTKGRNVDLFYVNWRNRQISKFIISLENQDSHSIVITIRVSLSLIHLVNGFTPDE
ncbi:hypothetical protein PMAYCL1PPCAC_11071, partial [Pristionchus mayeri]